MPDHLHRAADLESLRSLPRVSPQDRESLERILWLAPDVAVSTAAAVIRTHQPNLHALLFKPRNHPLSDVGQLARALTYLGLAMAAPVQGKILPILTDEHLREADRQVMHYLQAWGRATVVGAASMVESESIPDIELRRLLEALTQRAVRNMAFDPRWVYAVVFGEAATLYNVLDRACAEQFRGIFDVGAVTDQLERIARTRDLLVDVFPTDDAARTFDPERQRSVVARLRRYGWQEHVASRGRTLREISDEARAFGLHANTAFALSDEWIDHGGSLPTTGRRYFVRPTLLPDSAGLALWAQEERLKPLQRMLAGDPDETGLRLHLGSAELFLEFVVQNRSFDFLDGYWTRVANRFDGLQTRFAVLSPNSFAVTLFPGARLDQRVGVCPVIEVVTEAE